MKLRMSVAGDTGETMVVLLDRAVLLELYLQYLLLRIWKSRGGADFGTETHIA